MTTKRAGSAPPPHPKRAAPKKAARSAVSAPVAQPVEPARKGKVAGSKPAGGAKSLNTQQRLFVQEYLKDRNATHAAIRAGYSEKTARQIGSRLLSHVDIATAVSTAEEQHIAQVTAATGITLQRTLEEIAVLAYCDVGAIRGLGLDKKGGLDMLMKHLGGYKKDNEQPGKGLADAMQGLSIGLRFVEPAPK